MNRTRMAIGPPGKHLGKSRWPITTVLATTAGIFAAVAQLWAQAALFFGAALVLAVVTIRSYRK
ncbi:MAG: hypothetical protein ABI948_01415 [Thermoleophilia bacterium]